jgi:DeoR family ulaG and ulaABCDEF operon transcriptional repressor
MFMSVYGLSLLGLMEADPLLIQAEKRLISQAEELIVLADSSKFAKKAGLILCGLNRVSTVITDTGAFRQGGAAARTIRREGGHGGTGRHAPTPAPPISTRQYDLQSAALFQTEIRIEAQETPVAALAVGADWPAACARRKAKRPASRWS